MSQYQHILCAVDLSDDAKPVVAKASSMAHNNSAKLSLVHVIEPLSFAYGGDIPVDLSELQKQLQGRAKQKLAELGRDHNVENDDQYILVGSSVAEIHSLTERLHADLVVLGSHGRTGLALLLGSTSNGVLHGAKCDVLAVRVEG